MEKDKLENKAHSKAPSNKSMPASHTAKPSPGEAAKIKAKSAKKGK